MSRLHRVIKEIKENPPDLSTIPGAFAPTFNRPPAMPPMPNVAKKETSTPRKTRSRNRSKSKSKSSSPEIKKSPHTRRKSPHTPSPTGRKTRYLRRNLREILEKQHAKREDEKNKEFAQSKNKKQTLKNRIAAISAAQDILNTPKEESLVKQTEFQKKLAAVKSNSLKKEIEKVSGIQLPNESSVPVIRETRLNIITDPDNIKQTYNTITDPKIINDLIVTANEIISEQITNLDKNKEYIKETDDKISEIDNNIDLVNQQLKTYDHQKEDIEENYNLGPKYDDVIAELEQRIQYEEENLDILIDERKKQIDYINQLYDYRDDRLSYIRFMEARIIALNRRLSKIKKNKTNAEGEGLMLDGLYVDAEY